MAITYGIGEKNWLSEHEVRADVEEVPDWSMDMAESCDKAGGRLYKSKFLDQVKCVLEGNPTVSVRAEKKDDGKIDVVALRHPEAVNKVEIITKDFSPFAKEGVFLAFGEHQGVVKRGDGWEITQTSHIKQFMKPGEKWPPKQR